MRLFVTAAVVALASGCGGADTPPAQPGGAEHHEHGHHPPEHHEHGHHDDAAHGSHGHGAHGPLVHRFEDAEKWSKRFDDPKRDEWQRPAHVVERLSLKGGMTVADIGAGTGYFLPYLSPAVGDTGRVLALDIEPTMVEFMKKRGEREGWKNVEARVVAGDDPQLPAGAVDRILIVDTWHHIPQRVAYVGKLRDALSEGGWVAVVDFDLDSRRGPPREHKLAPEKVASELAEGGLESEILKEELPDQYIVVGRR